MKNQQRPVNPAPSRTGPPDAINRKAFGKKKREILRSHGVIRKPQKLMMLQIWALKFALLETAIEELERLVPDKLKRKLTEGTKDDIFKTVCDIIPDREWLKFARLKLKLKEEEIQKVKETCEMTREQMFHLMKYFSNDMKN